MSWRTTTSPKTTPDRPNDQVSKPRGQTDKGTVQTRCPLLTVVRKHTSLPKYKYTKGLDSSTQAFCHLGSYRQSMEQETSSIYFLYIYCSITIVEFFPSFDTVEMMLLDCLYCNPCKEWLFSDWPQLFAGSIILQTFITMNSVNICYKY